MHVVVAVRYGDLFCDGCFWFVLPHLVMAMGCDADGDIRLDFAENVEIVKQREYRLIQVCIFGQWIGVMCATGTLTIKLLIAVLSCSNFSAKMEVKICASFNVLHY